MYRIPKGHTPESWRARERIRDRARQHDPQRKAAKRKDAKNARKRGNIRNQTFVKDYLACHPCTECGETNHLVLDFDHVRDTKRTEVSVLVTKAYSLTTIQEEIAKCEVVCGNCHRRRTAKQLGWARLKGGATKGQRFVYAYLADHPCTDCGESEIITLEFDHRDPSEKRYSIGTMASSTYGIPTIYTEIQKCDVVCVNCHRLRTIDQNGWGKYRG